jgi:hypothetical protein
VSESEREGEGILTQLELQETFWSGILKNFHFEKPYTQFHSYNYDRTKGKVSVWPCAPARERALTSTWVESDCRQVV